MGDVSWTQLPLPPLEASEADVWQWDLISPLDVTRSRADLRVKAAEVCCRTTEWADAIECLVLAFEELASNGVRHGRSPVHARVVNTPGGWLVDISDAEVAQPPTPTVQRDPASGGLGLQIVAQLAACCGWMVERNRKHVWACVPGQAVIV